MRACLTVFKRTFILCKWSSGYEQDDAEHHWSDITQWASAWPVQTSAYGFSAQGWWVLRLRGKRMNKLFRIWNSQVRHKDNRSPKEANASLRGWIMHNAEQHGCSAGWSACAQPPETYCEPQDHQQDLPIMWSSLWLGSLIVRETSADSMSKILKIIWEVGIDGQAAASSTSITLDAGV